MLRNFIAVIMMLVHFFPVTVSSQSITLKESASEQRDYLHDLFQPFPGRYVAINYASPHSAFSMNRNTKHTKIIGYDSSLNETYSTETKELSGKKYLGGIVVDKKLHVFYSYKETVIRCELDANNGEVKGSPMAMFTATNQPSSLLKGFSADSSYCYAVFNIPSSNGKDEIFEGVVLDRSMNIITRFNFQLEKLNAYIDNTTCLLSPEGLLFIVSGIRVKPKKDDYRPLHYLITEISKEGKTVTTSLDNLPTGHIANLVWKASSKGLSFTGLLSKAEKKWFTSIISGEFSSWNKKATNLKEVEIGNSAFWLQGHGRWLQGVKTYGIDATASLVNSFHGEDGSVTLVLQKVIIEHTTHGDYSITGPRSSYTTTSSQGDNLYIMKIKPDHELAWVKMIPLGQKEYTSPIHSGTISLQHNKKDLVILFHDNESNFGFKSDEKYFVVRLGDSWDGTQLVALRVDENGNFSRSLVRMNMEDKHHFAPNEPFAVCGNEVIYTSYDYRKLGRSTYKLGSIKIQ